MIIEVKTRHNRWAGNPQDFITRKKIKHLVEATDEYIRSKNLDVEVRFDVIAVIINKQYEDLEHLKDAFYFF